jgi:hypothetical protein
MNIMKEKGTDSEQPDFSLREKDAFVSYEQIESLYSILGIFPK